MDVYTEMTIIIVIIVVILYFTSVYFGHSLLLYGHIFASLICLIAGFIYTGMTPYDVMIIIGCIFWLYASVVDICALYDK